jgi:hypothetical protein
MERFNFWYRWLLVISCVVVIFGAFMAILNQSPLFDLFNQQIDPVFWDDTAPLNAYAQFQGWVYGVLGSTMAGWGLMLFFVVRHPFQQREKWAWNAIAVSLGFWYLLDTGISLYFGVTFNAIFNTLLVFLVLPPLITTRKALVS